MTPSAVESVSASLSDVGSQIAAIQQRIAGLESLFGGSTGSFDAALAAATGTTDTTDPAVGSGAVDYSGLVANSAGTGDTSTAVQDALSQLGVPYQWGGESPGHDFDCSGLVQWAYGKAGISLPRVAADQAQAGVEVSAANAQPGDLVFFGSPVHHVGIYLGAGKMIDAPHTGADVRIESVDLSTCSAIRRVGPAATSTLSGLPAAAKPYLADIQAAAAQAGVSPALVAAVTWQESDFNPSATSSAGAEGLMQLMPATAAGLGANPTDPAQNLMAGAKYLADQLHSFDGRVDLALAAYNAGPNAVRSAGGVPDYPETQAYVKSVLAKLAVIRSSS
ncbi:MAG TPA: transglycosylase SLT domain-containing protein [Mycobacteriales bacterium]|nr:transglycosylase SLT domain-containing protein [Mycobacteriales bacterium]